MVYNIRFSIFIALFVTFSDAQWNTNDYMKREHSLVKPYQGSGFGIANWDFLGSTMLTNTHIRLTPNEQSHQGAIWNTHVRMKSKVCIRGDCALLKLCVFKSFLTI